MGCCNSGELEPPSISCTDSTLIHELESNVGSQHISQNSLLILIDKLNQQTSDKNRLEIIKENTDQKFILDDFDAILDCFTTSNGKLSATRILKKYLVGTEFNSGFLIKHFTNQQKMTALDSVSQSTSPSTQSLTNQKTANDKGINNQVVTQYT